MADSVGGIMLLDEQRREILRLLAGRRARRVYAFLDRSGVLCHRIVEKGKKQDMKKVAPLVCPRGAAYKERATFLGFVCYDSLRLLPEPACPDTR